MNNKCPFLSDGQCNIWLDYQIMQYTITDANELADSNWKEIQHLYDYIDRLKSVIIDAGLEPPSEY